MKKTLQLFLIAALLCVSSFAVAPSDSVLVGVYSGYSDSDGGPYGLRNRSEIHYDSLGREKYYSSYLWSGIRFVPSYKTSYAYDSLSRKTESVSYSASGNTWVNSTRTLWYYNSFQLLDSTVRQNWYGGAWVTSDGTYYTYNGAQHITYMRNYNYQYFYYPDVNNLDTVIIEQQYNGIAWNDYQKTNLYYDSTGLKIYALEYGKVGVLWVLDDSVTYSYNVNDSLETTRHYSWTSGSYQPVYADSMVYSGDTLFTYNGYWETDIGWFEYDSRTLDYDDGSGYNYYHAYYQYLVDSAWDDGGEYDKSHYDSVSYSARQEWASTGSHGSSTVQFDSDGHLVQRTSEGTTHSGDYSYGTSNYYYYLTNGAFGLCPGNSDSLSVDTGMISYAWNTGGTNYSKIVNEEGEYHCNLVNQFGHPFQSEPHYIYQSLFPTAQHEPDSSVTVCASNMQFHLKALDIPVYNYQWLRNDTVIPGANTAFLFYNYPYDPKIDGAYRLVVSNDCYSDTSGTTYIDFITPTVHILPSAVVRLCPGDTLQLAADTGFARYRWNTGDSTVTVISTVYHVNNAVTVTDSSGCTANTSVNVNAGVSASVLPLYITQTDSVLYASSGGGAQYMWFFNGDTIQGATASHIIITQTGYYKFTLNTGYCVIESQEKYIEYSLFRIEPGNTNLQVCLGSTFNFINSYNLSGASGTCHYQWAPSTGLNNDTIAYPTLTATVTQDYLLTVTDSLGNVVTHTFHIVVNTTVAVSLTVPQDSICPDEYGYYPIVPIVCNYTGSGFLNWYKNGSWFSSTQNDTLFTGQPGSYYVMVNNGCQFYSNTVTFTGRPNPPDAMIAPVSLPSDWCLIDSLTLVGYVPNPENYTFKWSQWNGSFYVYSYGDTLVVHDASYYNCYVTDIYGCTSVNYYSSYALIPDSVIPVTLNLSGMVTACYGDTVQLQATAYSGYNYHWKNFTNDLAGNSDNYNAIYSGQYFVNVDNGFGCHGSDSVYISFNLNTTTAALAYDGYNLVASSNQYIYPWQWYLNDTLIAGEISAYYHPLRPGVYKVIANSGACGSAIDSFVIQCTANVGITNLNCNQVCNGTAISIEDGTAPFNRAWSTGDTSSSLGSLCAGTYALQFIDGVGCLAIDSFVISEPAPLQSGHSISMATCNQSCNGVIDVTVNGGTFPYTYLWSTNSTDSSVNNLCAGNYTLDITDANGCSFADSFLITEPAAILMADSINQPLCYQSCNGSVYISVSGGTSPYHYQWSSGDSASYIENICSGTYVGSILDLNGCIGTDTIVVSEPLALQNTISESGISCFGECNDILSLNVTGGTQPYFYMWFDSSTANSVTVCAGNYSVVVSDANGCTGTDSILVSEPPPLVIADSMIDASCAACADGSVLLSIGGGSPPYSVQWSNGDSGIFISNVLPGEYIACITDDNLCTRCDTFTIGYDIMNGIPSAATGNEILVYPNPFSQNALVQLTFYKPEEKYFARIINDIGEIQNTYLVTGKEFEVSGANLASGIYLLQILDGNAVSVRGKYKLIVMH